MDDSRKIQLLWDKLAIDQLMIRFGRALDTHDWPAYRTCFSDEIEVDFKDLTGHEPVTVNADLWTAFARAALEPVRCLHQYTNHLVDIRGDLATSVLYMEAKHFRTSDRGSAENTQHGWYENRYERSNGRWLITRLGHHLAWITGNEGVLDLSSPEVRSAFEAVFGPSPAQVAA